MYLQNNLCRTCNTERNNLVNIFANDKKSRLKPESIKSMLEYCTKTTLNDHPEYPQGICHNCIKQVEIAYRFLKRFCLSQKEFGVTQAYVKETFEAKNGAMRFEPNAKRRCRNEQVQIEANLLISKHKLLEVTANGSRCKEQLIKMAAKYEGNFSDTTPAGHVDSNSPIDGVRTKLHQIDDSQAIVCDICHKAFLTTKALNLHLKINHKRTIMCS